MTDADILRALAHDVGKHATRAALNLPAKGPIPAILRDMLIDDLYGRDDRPPASAIFDALLPTPGPLAHVRAVLTEIDVLESAVRAGDDDVARRAAALALAVRDRLLERL